MRRQSDAGVPVVDVAALVASGADAAPDACAAIAEAGVDWGFFQIEGHGLSGALEDRFSAQMRAFFALPDAAKAAVRRTAANARGYYDAELTKNARDWKEIFDYQGKPAPGRAAADAANRNLDGSNQWPAGLRDFEGAMLAWLDACTDVALSVLGGLCAGLGLPARRLHGAFASGHSSFVRLNHYPPCDDPAHEDRARTPDRGSLGVNHHYDAGALTLVLQDDVPSLQVYRGDRWHTVEPRRGGLVVNVGDMLQVWTNDRVRAPLHRVLAQRDRARYSAPYFLNPAYDTDCAPLPEFVDASNPARYRPVNWGEYRSRRAAGDYADVGVEVQIDQYRLGTTSDPAA